MIEAVKQKVVTAARRPVSWVAMALALSTALSEATDIPKTWWILVLKIALAAYIVYAQSKGRQDDAQNQQQADQAGA